MIPEPFDITMNQIILAREDEEAMNQFIRQNKRFIMASAYRAAGHFVTESDDEWSIALIAFHEAVQTYDQTKGDFRAFAAMVIKRRLIDYSRSEARHSSEIAMESYSMDGDVQDDEDATALQLEVRRRQAEAAESATDRMPGTTPMQDEIAAVQELLQQYGFSFFDLADCSPKAEKTKKHCAQAVVALLENAELFQKMRLTHALPIKELERLSGVSRKILDRHRKYIIAAAEILNVASDSDKHKEQLTEIANNSLGIGDENVTLVVTDTTVEERDKARDLGISAGRYEEMKTIGGSEGQTPQEPDAAMVEKYREAPVRQMFADAGRIPGEEPGQEPQSGGQDGNGSGQEPQRDAQSSRPEQGSQESGQSGGSQGQGSQKSGQSGSDPGQQRQEIPDSQGSDPGRSPVNGEKAEAVGAAPDQSEGGSSAPQDNDPGQQQGMPGDDEPGGQPEGGRP